MSERIACHAARMVAKLDASRSAFLIVLTLAAVVRLSVAAFLSDTDLQTAQIWEYGEMARGWMATGEISRSYEFADVTIQYFPSAFMPPALVWLWMGLFKIFGENSTALVAFLGLNVMLSVASVALTGLIIRRMFNSQSVAIFSMVIMIFYPTFAFAVATYHAIYFHLTLLLLAFFIASVRKKLSVFDSLTLGLIGGLAALIRTEYVFLFAGLMIWAFWKRGNLRIFLLSVFVAGLCTMPWTVRNFQVFHKFVPIAQTSGFNLYKGFSIGANGSGNYLDENREEFAADELAKIRSLPRSRLYEAEVDAIWLQSALQYMDDNKIRSFLILPLRKFAFFWVYDPYDPIAWKPLFQIAFWPVFFLALVGMYQAIEQGFFRRYEFKLMLSVFFFQSLIIAAYAVHLRYRMNVEPFLFGFAAFGLNRLVFPIRRKIPI